MGRKRRAKAPAAQPSPVATQPTAAEPEPPTESWQGTLEPDEGAPYAAAEVTFEAGETKLARSYRPSCALRLADGTRVEVAISSGGLPGWPEHTMRGPWSEFEQRPWAALFVDVAPGPHVPVKLRFRGPPAGAEAVVRGTAEYGAATSNELGYRAAPELVLQRIRAEEIRPPETDPTEPTPRKAAAPAPPAAPSRSRVAVDWYLAGCALGCVAAAVYPLALHARMPRSALGTLACALMAFAMLAAGLVVLFEALRIQSTSHPAARDGVLPYFPRGNTLSTGASTRLVAWVLAGSGLGMSAPMFWIYGEKLVAAGSVLVRETDENGAAGAYAVSWLAIISALALLGVGAMAAFGWATRWRSARLVRLLLAPPSKPEALRPGAWVTLAGRIEARGSQRLAAKYSFHVVFRGSEDSDNKQEGGGQTYPWQLETEHGSLAAGGVGAGATWGTSIIERTGSRRFFRPHEYTDVRLAPDGAWVLVAGRLVPGEGGKLSLGGRGEESLVFYASTEDARPMLRQRLRAHGALLALAAVTILAGIAGIILTVVLPAPG